eukprot:CAMPEP_0201500262 /NCGR_PEP_ID=MMETSP0151_2-20130828/80626_1 /ASSEMBLY_ACC=CAM_ASM_000257 /TAXON_ID=200890 /ORGANISM="Paramoeba atlantica, Strain 621/1 / CCAP 1560/9" /LENGTH=98 /DNA_ID=CAMNT_0047893361 /DNA_START=42 /DNA_END=335 /DNA_ORIENTATION=-
MAGEGDVCISKRRGHMGGLLSDLQHLIAQTAKVSLEEEEREGGEEREGDGGGVKEGGRLNKVGELTRRELDGRLIAAVGVVVGVTVGVINGVVVGVIV